MTLRYKLACVCALATPIIVLMVAGVELFAKPSGFYTAILWTIVAQILGPMWFLYWISRVCRKGKPLFFKIVPVR